MSTQLGIVMDSLQSVNVKKDSTLGMLRAAWARGWQVHYLGLGDLSLQQEVAWGRLRRVTPEDGIADIDNIDAPSTREWYSLGEQREAPLGELDVILMRKDPPFDMNYIYATYLLEQAQAAGALVVNAPRSLRDCNEKLFIAHFPQCCPPFLVAAEAARLKAFHAEYNDVVYKPLDGMGGTGVFRVQAGDPNLGVVIETLTDMGRVPIMAQQFIPEISSTGDKRILLIDGEPVAQALARIPPQGENRGNLAVGGKGEARPLTERDRWICAQLAPELQKRGLMFAGIDVIGDYLTEINVTSPTGLREIDRAAGCDIGGMLMDSIANKLANKQKTRK